MSSAWSMPLRAFATQTAAITMIGIGLAAPAAAAQGDLPDNASDTATAATAEASENQAARAEAAAASTTTATATTTSEASTHASTHASANASTKSSTKADVSTGPDHSQGNAGTSGGYNTPQPPSNADLNDGGANAGSCPGGHSYCSTRDGSASQNGRGDGEATGKPCAGCVGKADNKNPKGQYPNGSDHNAGYECDRNQGIGQTNPAHTGCRTTPTTSVQTCPDGSPMPPSGNIKDCVKVTPPGGGGGVTPPGGGGGVTPPGGGGGSTPPGIGGVDTGVPPAVTPPAVTPPVVKGVETLVPPEGVELFRPPAQAPEAAPQAPSAAVLPATGATSTVTALSALAFGLLALGSGLLLYRRVWSS